MSLVSILRTMALYCNLSCWLVSNIRRIYIEMVGWLSLIVIPTCMHHKADHGNAGVKLEEEVFGCRHHRWTPALLRDVESDTNDQNSAKWYHCTGIVIAARAVYRAGRAMAVMLHSPTPAQYVVVPTESRADPWPKKMTGGSGATFPRLASRCWMDRRDNLKKFQHWQ
jgi:hypothetical protein